MQNQSTKRRNSDTESCYDNLSLKKNDDTELLSLPGSSEITAYYSADDITSDGSFLTAQVDVLQSRYNVNNITDILSLTEKESINVDTVSSICSTAPSIVQDSSAYFDDGIRRIDFVLVHAKNSAPEIEDARNTFETNLHYEGLELEYAENEEIDLEFVKIHAPWEVLSRYGEIMQFKMPIKELADFDFSKYYRPKISQQSSVISRSLLNIFEPLPSYSTEKRLTFTFSRNKEYLFAVPKRKEDLFNPAQRSQIVEFILKRKRFTRDPGDVFGFGIKKLLADGAYVAAYPLHEGTCNDCNENNPRRFLLENWASIRRIFKQQPLDHIRSYFGVKIGLYFAWLGFYTYMLISASVVGVVCFIYGCITLQNNVPSKEICGSMKNITMCPLCEQECRFWKLGESCNAVSITYLFDNAATAFYAVFISIWGTVFLELWKRYSARITYRWDLTGLDSSEEHPRPEYLARLANAKKRLNVVTQMYEPHAPFWKRKVPYTLLSMSVVLLLKSDVTSTSSHEFTANNTLHVHNSPVLGIDGLNRSQNTTPSPDQSPKVGLKLSSQGSHLSIHSTSNSTHPQSPTSSPISSIPNSRETSVEKSLDAGNLIATLVNHDSVSTADNISRSSESCKSVDWTSLQKSPDSLSKLDLSSRSERSSSKGSEKKDRKKTWYNLLNPTYKNRSDDFKRLFKDLPESERLIVDYSCAMQKDILVHGRLYVSQNYICFYANIFRWETFVMLRCRDVTSMTKEKTARVIPNAVQICTETEKYFFTSFGARDKTYLMLFRIWQNALMDQPMSSQELWQWVHYSYGEELGLTSDDDDYVPPLTIEDDHKNNNQIDHALLIKENEEVCEKLNLITQDGDDLTKHDMSNESLTGTGESCEPPDLLDHPSLQIDQAGDTILKQKSSEYPTDLSDTTESDINGIDAGEIHCSCDTHDGKEMMDTVFPVPVDQLFTLLFTGSKFYHDLLETRKTYDIVESLWQLCPDLGHKMRQVTYTLTLNHSMAKSAQTTETQRLSKQSKPGHMYIVDCDVVNTGIPYSDTFCVKSLYCLTRVSSRHSRLRVHGHVHYKKSVWGLVKSLIEKSAMQGLCDFCTDLETALNKEIERSTQQTGKKHPRRRKRMKDSGKLETHETPRIMQRQASIRKIASSISGLDIGMLGSTPDFVVKVILITLVVLVLLNVLLFYKLWSLEDQSLALSNSNLEWLDLPIENSQSPLKQQDFVKLLRQQDTLHRMETKRWQEALGEIIKLIHLIEDSLSDLKSSIDSYSTAATFKAFLSVDSNQPIDSSLPTTGAQTLDEDSPISMEVDD